jgi:hypothetical protein
MDTRLMTDRELTQALTLVSMRPSLAHLADELRAEAARRLRSS